jgi:hypothetical protein
MVTMGFCDVSVLRPSARWSAAPIGMSGSPTTPLEVGAITDTAPTICSEFAFCGSLKVG